MSLSSQPEQSESVKSMEEITIFLRGQPVFQDAPVDVLRLYAYLAGKETYEPGEVIIEQGTASDRMFLIMQGRVSICERRRERSFHLQTLSGDGINYFGELALLAEFDWFFTARADTEVTLLSISREAFIKIHERFPAQYPLAVERIVKLRIRRFVNQIDYLLDHIPSEAWKECSGVIDQKTNL